MLISAFAQATGLTPDTIRFYIRQGLLEPQLGTKGGRNPYQMFDEAHVHTAALIRLGQALGMSLKEIGALLADGREGRLGPEQTRAILRDQRDRLRRKSADLTAMADYLDAKLAWVDAGAIGPQPVFPSLPANRSPCPDTERAAGNPAAVQAVERILEQRKRNVLPESVTIRELMENGRA